MSPQEIFRIWAPEEALWSPWAKPTLFSTLGKFGHRSPSGLNYVRENQDRPGLTGYDAQQAIVLEVPGAPAVGLALILARNGYRPVPLFNACDGEGAILDQMDLRQFLYDGTEELKNMVIRPQASPVFILDSRRMNGRPSPRQFDNRWMVFPQDFPSARFLSAQGIKRVCLMQAGYAEPADDLAHILRAWQEGGLEIYRDNVQDSVKPEALQVKKPSGFKWMFYRLLALSGLRKNSAGGFGMPVPDPTQSTGYG